MKELHACVVLAMTLVACRGSQVATATADGPNRAHASSNADSGADELNAENQRSAEGFITRIRMYESKFKTVCGTAVKIEVDWSSFRRDRVALEAVNSKDGFRRIAISLLESCKNDSGRNFVKTNIQTVRVLHVHDAAQANVTLNRGTLNAALNWGHDVRL